MTDSAFTFDDAKFKAAMRSLEKALTDMTPIMSDIGQTLQDMIRERLVPMARNELDNIHFLRWPARPRR